MCTIIVRHQVKVHQQIKKFLQELEAAESAGSLRAVNQARGAIDFPLGSMIGDPDPVSPR